MGMFGGENGAFGGILNGLFGGATGGEKQLGNYANAAFDSSEIQRFLPSYLQNSNLGPYMRAGVQNYGQLLQNPGGISANLSQAIAPFLANQSQDIATNFRGIGQNQAGAAARSNLPISIKNALGAALDIQQERAQREARFNAMGQSEQLRRQDINNIFPMLDALQQYTGQGRQSALQGFGAQAAIAQQRQAANEAFVASIIQSLAGSGAMGKP